VTRAGRARYAALLVAVALAASGCSSGPSPTERATSDARVQAATFAGKIERALARAEVGGAPTHTQLLAVQGVIETDDTPVVSLRSTSPDGAPAWNVAFVGQAPVRVPVFGTSVLVVLCTRLTLGSGDGAAVHLADAPCPSDPRSAGLLSGYADVDLGSTAGP
jgi:hypothetical protein